MSATSRSDSAKKSASVRRASSIAGRTNKNAKPSSPSDFCKLTRAAIEFQIMMLQSELKVLDELSEMTDNEKMDTLFELLDKNGDRKISAVELADGLRKIRGDVDFDESLELAINRVAIFDNDGDAKLDREEFEKFVKTLLEALGCTFTELSEMLVMQVLFSVSGNTVLENVAGELISNEVDEAVKEEEEILHKLADERMEALFALFDIDNSGTIDFKEIVIGMYKVTDDIDGASKVAMSALLMFDENSEEKRSLEYEEFTKLMINITVTSNTKFDDLADSLTRLAAQPMMISDEEISGLFAMDASLDRLKDMENDESTEKISAVEFAKIDRLFDLFDLDNNGFIDFHELALGLRKFQETTDMTSTVDQCIKAMDAHDTNSDEKLDRKEFAQFIARFAKMADSDLQELVDFMIVTTTFKENTEAEEKYIKSITKSDLYYWGC